MSQQDVWRFYRNKPVIIRMPADGSDQVAAAVLTLREQWRLFCWMTAHPRALLEDTVQARGERREARARPRHCTPIACSVILLLCFLLLRRRGRRV